MKPKRSIVHNWSDLRLGSVGRRNESAVTEMLVESSYLLNLRPTLTYEHVVNKMLSSLEWHPKNNQVLVGSRGGDVSCIDVDSHSVRQCIYGRGRGQQTTGIRFDLLDNNWFYTSSTSGKLIKHRLDSTEDIILKDSYQSEDLFYSSSRFSCLDVCSDRKLLIAGDSKGFTHLLPTSCESSPTVAKSNQSVIHSHNSNILHCEFNRFNSNLFITASIDSSAKLWDLRMIANKCPKAVLTIRQSRLLNSATFSLTNGSTLLLTNHFDEISVYRGPDWQLERCIRHSHEQTQRFCLLKPVWHPFLDIFVIGSFTRDPEVSGQYLDRPQTVDIFDAKSGTILKSISDGTSGVISIGSFNSSGDIIAGIKGQNLIVFKSISKDRN